jgi:hypothetical protein
MHFEAIAPDAGKIQLYYAASSFTFAFLFLRDHLSQVVSTLAS